MNRAARPKPLRNGYLSAIAPWAWFRFVLGIIILAQYPFGHGWHRPFNLVLGVVLVAMGAAELECESREP